MCERRFQTPTGCVGPASWGVQQGERVLFDEVRCFFCLTNRWDLSVEQIVSLANGRCDQENVIEQLKNGVNAMRMPPGAVRLDKSPNLKEVTIGGRIEMRFDQVLPARAKAAYHFRYRLPAQAN